MDRFDPHTRSKIMASVGQKNTSAELALRTALYHIGLRYRLHDRSLPGSSDLVFPRFHAVVFVHGCYWHSHGCYRSTVPKSRRDFWTEKFDANRSRGGRNANFASRKRMACSHGGNAHSSANRRGLRCRRGGGQSLAGLVGAHRRNP